MQKTKDAVFLSVVLYTYNQEKIVFKTLQDIHACLKDHFDKFEFVVVDNCSSDQTVAQIKSFGQDVTLIELLRPQDLEYAMQAGIDFAIGDYVIEIDNPDLNFDASVLYDLFLKAQEGYDVVSLVPQKSKMSRRLFYKFMNRFVTGGIDLNVNTEIATLLSRRTLNALTRIKDKTHFRKIMYKIVGHKSTEISYKPKYVRQSTRPREEQIRLALDVLFSFTTLGMNINFFLTGLFLAMTLLGGAYTVYEYLFNSHIVQGWTTIMLFLSFGFSGLFVILTIICKYITMVLREVKTTPTYYIKQIQKLS